MFSSVNCIMFGFAGIKTDPNADFVPRTVMIGGKVGFSVTICANGIFYKPDERDSIYHAHVYDFYYIIMLR